MPDLNPGPNVHVENEYQKMMQEKPVTVVTVNFNGKKYLPALFDSLKSQTYRSLKVVMVDNGSNDGSADFVRREYPWVTVVRNARNVGFAEGNNIGLRHCMGEFVVLVNNDMVVDRDWLSNLVSTAVAKGADVVGPKILFYKPFLSFRFETSTFDPGNGDTRRLGVRLVTDMRFESSGYDKILFGDNVYGEETASDGKYRWISDGGIVRIPYDPKSGVHKLIFRVAAPEGKDVHALRLFLGDGTSVFDSNITDTFQEYEVRISEADVRRNGRFVVNNASSEYSETTGYGRDVGMGEDDCGQYDDPNFVQALCGGCMLIRTEILGDAGVFDRYFFAYYEDTDFCWRMNTAARKLYYEPKSIVYHVHTGTSKEWSPFFYYHTDRNRLAMLLKNGAWAVVARETRGHIRLIFEVRRYGIRLSMMRVAVLIDLLVHAPYLLGKRYF